MPYKIVCLPTGIEFPVPERHKWLAMDNGGGWYTYQSEPRAIGSTWIGPDWPLGVPYIHGPFEPGPWTEQLYDIS